MLPTSLFTAALLLSGAYAQRGGRTTSAEDSSATEDSTRTADAEETKTTTSKGIATHTVNVGAAGHKFTPDSLEAEVGDIVEWRFYPSAHWVIRGDLENPCIPYEYVDLNREGFSSGIQKVEAILDDGPRFRVRVNDTKPIWFYCGAPGSCTRWKMLGVVNPTKNETIDTYIENAKDVDFQLRPGDPWPTESDFPAPTNAATDATGHKPTQSSDSEESGGGGGGGGGLSPGAIAGIVIGSVAVLIIGAGLIYLCGRRGGFDKAYRKSAVGSTSTSNAFNNGATTMSEQSGPHNSAGMTEAWVAGKQAGGSVAGSQFQSPPMSPQPTATFGNFPQNQSTLKPVFGPDGTITSYYDPSAGQHYARGSPHLSETPQPPQQETFSQPPSSPPAELPTTFVELGDGRSLPSYNSPTAARKFSFPGDEEGPRSPGR